MGKSYEFELNDQVEKEILKILTDARCRRGPNLYRGELNGKKTGIPLATMSQGYDSCALNVAETEQVIKAVHDGRIDQGIIVATKRNEFGIPTILAAVYAEEFHQAVLQNKQTKSGRLGLFWVVFLYEFLGDEPRL